MTFSTIQRPSVGVGCLVFRNGLVLAGRRQGAHGENTWSVPGGHLEWNESPEECAAREVLEETGVHIKNAKVIGTTNDIFTKENKHYVTVFVQAEWASGEPSLVDHTYVELRWCKLEDIPHPRFLPLQNLLDQGYKS